MPPKLTGLTFAYMLDLCGSESMRIPGFHNYAIFKIGVTGLCSNLYAMANKCIVVSDVQAEYESP